MNESTLNKLMIFIFVAFTFSMLFYAMSALMSNELYHLTFIKITGTSALLTALYLTITLLFDYTRDVIHQ